MTKPSPSSSAEDVSAPDQDRGETHKPTFIANFINILQTLIGYGTRLRDTLPFHREHKDFLKFATAWGQHDPSLILIQIQRGILRAIALKTYCEARLAKGRDIVPTPPAAPAEEEDAANLPFQFRDPPKTEPTTPKTPRTYPFAPCHIDFDDPMYMCVPTPRELEKWLKSGSVSRLLAEVCLDLGITPGNTAWETFQRFMTLLRGFDHQDGEKRYYQIKDRRAQRVLNDIEGGGRIFTYKVREGDTKALIRAMLGFMCGEPEAPSG